MGFTIAFCVRPISPQPFEDFHQTSQMFLSVGWCAGPMTQGHCSRSWDLPLSFVSAPFERFSLNLGQMFLSLR